jgi:RNA polymerase sigma-70 factor (ECF subfamily)
VIGGQGDPTDRVLIDGFLRGDELAFRALYRRHAPRLRMLILRLLGSRRSAADDLLQDAWVAACRGLGQYRGDAQFSTWLSAIAIRLVRRHLQWTIDAAALEDGEPSDHAASCVERLEVEQALARLTDAQRAVVVLHDIEGYTHEEIAASLGIAAGTSRSLLTRARRALRALLPGVNR